MVIKRLKGILRQSDVDLTWRMEKMRRRIATFYVVFGLYLLFLALQYTLNGWTDVVVQVGAWALVAIWAAAAAVLWLLPKSRLRLFEATEIVSLFVSGTVFSLSLMDATAAFGRVRGQTIVLLIGLFIPNFTCLRVRLYLPFAVMWLITQTCITFWSEWRHGFQVPLSTVFSNAFLCAVFSTAAIAQGMILRSFHRAEVSFLEETHAAKSLVSMLCDAWLVLGADGETVMRSDGRFDNMMGRPMLGESLSRFLFEQDHSDSLYSAIKKVFSCDPVPVDTVIHLDLRGSGGRLKVALFIVRSAVAEGPSAFRESHFLVGINQIGEEERPESHFQPPVPQTLPEQFLDCRISEPGGMGTASMAPSANTAAAFAMGQHTTITDVLEQLREIGQREHWLISNEDVQLQRNGVLGRGAFGGVLAGSYYGATVAVKVVEGAKSGSYIRAFAALARELRILRRCRHPNLVQLHGAVCDVDAGCLGLVMEKASCGDLAEWMKRSSPSDACRFRIVAGVIRGLCCLHCQDPPVVHGDLKSRNVLVSLDGGLETAKLADFGLAQLDAMGEQRLTGGTLAWSAPEVGRREKKMQLHAGADIFSFGRVAQHICLGVRPLAHANLELLKLDLEQGIVWQPEVPKVLSALQGQILPCAQDCLEPDWRRRPGCRDVHHMLMQMDISLFDDQRRTARRTVDEAVDVLPWVAQALRDDSPVCFDQPQGSTPSKQSL